MVWRLVWCELCICLRKMAGTVGGVSHHTHMPYTAHQVHQHTKPLTWWAFGLLCLAPFIVPAIGLLLIRLA